MEHVSTFPHRGSTARGTQTAAAARRTVLARNFWKPVSEAPKQIDSPLTYRQTVVRRQQRRLGLLHRHPTRALGDHKRRTSTRSGPDDNVPESSLEAFHEHEAFHKVLSSKLTEKWRGVRQQRLQQTCLIRDSSPVQRHAESFAHIDERHVFLVIAGLRTAKLHLHVTPWRLQLGCTRLHLRSPSFHRRHNAFISRSVRPVPRHAGFSGCAVLCRSWVAFDVIKCGTAARQLRGDRHNYVFLKRLSPLICGRQRGISLTPPRHQWRSASVGHQNLLQTAEMLSRLGREEQSEDGAQLWQANHCILFRFEVDLCGGQGLAERRDSVAQRHEHRSLIVVRVLVKLAEEAAVHDLRRSMELGVKPASQFRFPCPLVLCRHLGNTWLDVCQGGLTTQLYKKTVHVLHLVPSLSREFRKVHLAHEVRQRHERLAHMQSFNLPPCLPEPQSPQDLDRIYCMKLQDPVVTEKRRHLRAVP
mmetsp:Transcript_66078/g.175116  ORF Transcript_66078/g.175116 Transcript_66078/m.175116 type:complete len:473 (-) Transcript_66078:1365-2783(-)